jgi:predicted DNA-binding protein (UPF0251 family)
MTTRPMPAGNFSPPASIQVTGPQIGISGSVVTKTSSSQADEALVKLYDGHARPLLGLAALLVWGAERAPAPPIDRGTATGESFPEYAHNAGRPTGEFSATQLLMALDVAPGIAEEIVEDAFAAMRLQWRRLRDSDRCVAFLRRFVVDAARSVDSLPEASHGGPPVPGGRTLAALWQLPGRQREALVLRYYADLHESQAAAAMGVTRAAFRWHVQRGMAALRLGLDAHGVAGLSTAQCTAVHRRLGGCALRSAFMHSNSQRHAQGVHRVIHRRLYALGRYQAEED